MCCELQLNFRGACERLPRGPLRRRVRLDRRSTSTTYSNVIFLTESKGSRIGTSTASSAVPAPRAGRNVEASDRPENMASNSWARDGETDVCPVNGCRRDAHQSPLGVDHRPSAISRIQGTIDENHRHLAIEILADARDTPFTDDDRGISPSQRESLAERESENIDWHGLDELGPFPGRRSPRGQSATPLTLRIARSGSGVLGDHFRR